MRNVFTSNAEERVIYGMEFSLFPCLSWGVGRGMGELEGAGLSCQHVCLCLSVCKGDV